MKNNSISKVLEIFWLFIFIATLILGIFNSIKFGFAENYMFFVLSGLSFVIFWARKKLRLKEKIKDQK